MKTLKQILSTVLLAAFILVMSQMIYGRIVGLEEDRCWQELSTTAQSVAEEMETKFKDEIVKLHLIKEIMSEEYNVGSKNYIANIHIEKIQATTIFERIDVLFPNHVIVSNGKDNTRDNRFSKGHLQGRISDRKKNGFCNRQGMCLLRFACVGRER